ncbi:HD-GYP domain-containing protein [[Clostridium] polysaccharolyticum]|jgi:putative nucleotidyltransferase with HDIG domain|uniref:HDIG domain-containing protein n=1 Tax=[Clostridium] polysaccharolyticum TaxID=29364 RepID=A0A1I0DYF4_9FIRM|nr:HD domain-containing phosphohydrolase [[Clostridium] polysaccharolyticum]SET36912.1 HDIG domain-containing protein [[Clostridium] polysaccharolyticum]
MCLTEQNKEPEDAMRLAVKEDLEYAINHGIIVSNLAYYVAKELGKDDSFCSNIAMAGMLHDIGKLKLSKYLYGRKKDTLKIEEIKYVRMHSTFSYKILKEMGFQKEILEAVYYHHENYDGTGYPDNLKEKAIPLSARILRTCDVFAALVSNRPYREAFDIDTAIELMIDEYKNFDMKVFLAFQRFINSEQFKPVKELICEKENEISAIID